jgi:hypothetical protein
MEDAALEVKADAATAFFSFKTMYYIVSGSCDCVSLSATSLYLV